MDVLEPELLACLEKLVGLSRTECPCYADLPLDETQRDRITTSTSGLFIDEDPDFDVSSLLRETGCNNNATMWDKLLKARSRAIYDVVEQISVSLNDAYKPRTEVSKFIGEMSYNGYLPMSAGQITTSLKTANLPGAVMHLTHMTLAGKLAVGIESTTIEVHIKRMGANTDLAVYNIDVTMKSTFMGRQPDTDVYSLPDDGIELLCDGSVYLVYYTLNPDVFTPISNVFRCVTCPATIKDLSPFFSELPTGYAYGLIMSFRFTCKPQYLACALTQNVTLKGLIAGMINARTISIWLGAIAAKKQAGVNVRNVLDANVIQPIREVYDAVFINKLNVITNSFNIQDTELGCFVCRSGAYARNAKLKGSDLEKSFDEMMQELSQDELLGPRELYFPVYDNSGI